MTSPSEQRPGRRNPPLRASTLELFFDLVFVFTITQLTVIVAAALVAEWLLRRDTVKELLGRVRGIHAT